MMQTQPLEIADFSLGITDYFIDGPPQAAKTMDNLFLTTNAKLRTRWGSVVVNDQMPLGAFRVNKLARFESELIAFQDKRAYYDNAGVWTQILGPSAGTFMPAGNSASVIIDSDWQKHLFFSSDALTPPQKLFIDNTSTHRVVNAGLPLVNTGFAITPATGAGFNYLYAFCISYEYMVGTVTYLDRGPVYYFPTTISGGDPTIGTPINIVIPTTYTPTDNWDTVNWKVEIYRTATNGSAYFKVDEVTFGTAAYADILADTSLQSNEALYTTGGIASNDTPPQAKYVHIVNDYGYWAHTQEGTELLSTTVYQSKAGDPDSVPATFFADAEQPITGLSSIYDKPMIFCTSNIYRIDNYYADDGTGGMLLRRIDDRAGCVSAQSIVRTHMGIFWFGSVGIYWSDGFRVECISDHLNETYKDFVATTTRQKNISGTFDPSNQRVLWTASKDDGTGENDMMISLDLRYPFLKSTGRTACFTTLSGSTNFKPTQTLVIGEYFYRGDTRGYVLKHGIGFFTDPRIDTAVAATLWEEKAIIHNYESCFLDFGSKFYRKWVPRILISADNTTNLSIAISSSNDNNRVRGDLKPIRYRNNITWGDSTPVWGDPSALWNSQGLIEEWRRFPAGGLRCNYKQILITNASLKIIDSTLLGTATTNFAAKTATLGGSYEWLPGSVDYYISFEVDNYTKEFQIISQTATTVTYSDPNGGSPALAGPYNWVISGKPKGEVLILNGYVIHWAYISKSHTPFSSSSLGSNPT